MLSSTSIVSPCTNDAYVRNVNGISVNEEMNTTTTTTTTKDDDNNKVVIMTNVAVTSTRESQTPAMSSTMNEALKSTRNGSNKRAVAFLKPLKDDTAQVQAAEKQVGGFMMNQALLVQDLPVLRINEVCVCLCIFVVLT